jgi:DNA-binding GntR family transcriptional regulator
MNSLSPAEHFKTKNEMVYDYLKLNIVNKNIKPGEKIIIRDISRHLHISDIPVREAIKKLETQGLVDVIPHVGARVARINREEMEEIYIIRSELEALATRLAVKYLKEADFTRLERNLEKYEEALRAGKSAVFSNLNKEFHLEIYKSSPYKGLFKMISEAWEKSQMIRGTFRLPDSLREKSLKEHRLILNALKRGNGKTAGEITRRQKINSYKAFSRFIEE